MKNVIILILLLFKVGELCAQTATFLSKFEDKNTTAEIGVERIELYDGDTLYVVPNPHPDAFNSSSYVLKLSNNEGSRNRAEYDAWRNETNEKTYFYSWKRYHPADMFRDIEMDWGVINQWKTWPCEVYGTGDFEIYDTLISYSYNGGIFNETRMIDTSTYAYLSRAEPCRRADYYTVPKGYWNQFVLEVYWTNTENGYYRLWRNDTLIAYTDHIKTLFDEFIKRCNMYWSTGLYTKWTKTGNKTQDELVAYVDDISIYDADSSNTIYDICPNCDKAPIVPSGDSNVYKVNVYDQYSSDGYNNYILRWHDKTYMFNLSNTYGQNSDIDIYTPTDIPSGGETSSISDECFPNDVIGSFVYWTDETKSIELKGLNTNNTYTVKVLSSGGSYSHYGIQIWTTESIRDTVLSYGNTCKMAELTNLISDENGDLTIYIAPITTRAYLNAIEIVEYIDGARYVDSGWSKKTGNELFPNPVKGILHIDVGSIPESVTVYTYDGRIVKVWGNMTEIDVSALPRGIYIASIKIETSTIHRVFIKV